MTTGTHWGGIPTMNPGAPDISGWVQCELEMHPEDN